MIVKAVLNSPHPHYVILFFKRLDNSSLTIMTLHFFNGI